MRKIPQVRLDCVGYRRTRSLVIETRQDTEDPRAHPIAASSHRDQRLNGAQIADLAQRLGSVEDSGPVVRLCLHQHPDERLDRAGADRCQLCSSLRGPGFSEDPLDSFLVGQVPASPPTRFASM